MVFKKKSERFSSRHLQQLSSNTEIEEINSAFKDQTYSIIMQAVLCNKSAILFCSSSTHFEVEEGH